MIIKVIVNKIAIFYKQCPSGKLDPGRSHCPSLVLESGFSFFSFIARFLVKFEKVGFVLILHDMSLNLFDKSDFFLPLRHISMAQYSDAAHSVDGLPTSYWSSTSSMFFVLNILNSTKSFDGLVVQHLRS